jgi:hypothetical protein
LIEDRETIFLRERTMIPRVPEAQEAIHQRFHLCGRENKEKPAS